jgi:hypothetical protein
MPFDLIYSWETRAMRRLGFKIAAIVLGCAIAGCGDSEVQEGPREFKTPNTEGLSRLRDSMAENIKKGEHKKKPVEGKTAEGKAAEAKPSDEKK